LGTARKTRTRNTIGKSVKRAIAANNQPIRTLGVAFLKIKMDDEVFIQKFVVTADTHCLLGMDYLQQNIKSINLTQHTLNIVNEKVTQSNQK
jgi:hypothetical protein